MDHAFLSTRSTVPTPNREDTFNTWALTTFLPCITLKTIAQSLSQSPFLLAGGLINAPRTVEREAFFFARLPKDISLSLSQHGKTRAYASLSLVWSDVSPRMRHEGQRAVVVREHLICAARPPHPPTPRGTTPKRYVQGGTRARGGRARGAG